MKIREIITESKRLTEGVGRELQHVEDIIYIDGPEAALEVVNRLAQLGQDSKTMTIKWDGSPAVVFGRDESGQFHFGDKHSKEMITSPDAIAQLVMSRAYKGKGDPQVDADRKKFAASQSYIWKLYETATPKDFRGFVTGDLMWQQTPEVVGNELAIAPNTVQYFVNRSTPLGQKMTRSKSGVALHFYSKVFGGETQSITPDILNRLGSNDVIVLGPKSVAEAQAKVNTKELENLAATIKKSAKIVNDYLAPMPGLSNIANDIYTYTNSNADVLDSKHFMEWASTKFTNKKMANLEAKGTQGLDAIFNIMRHFMKVKVDIINQLEGPGLGGMGIRAVLKKTGDKGGEGLVDTGSDQPLKFVNRATFSKANRMR